MTEEEFKQAANYWKEKDVDNVKLDEESLKAAVLEYIQENDTCALATGAGSFVRCTPIEYKYHNDAFWMFTEGGEKFIALEKNSNVCIAIFEKYAGFGKLKGMQVTGTAEIVEPFTEEYVHAAKIRKIPMEALKKMEHPMNLIKITPKRIDFLNSDFKQKGCASRQFIEF